MLRTHYNTVDKPSALMVARVQSHAHRGRDRVRVVKLWGLEPPLTARFSAACDSACDQHHGWPPITSRQATRGSHKPENGSNKFLVATRAKRILRVRDIVQSKVKKDAS